MKPVHRFSLTAMVAGLLAAFTAAPSLAAELVLEPTSDWRLREYEDKCRISRNFGTEEDKLTLWIDKGGPGPGVNITLIGRPVRSPYGATVYTAFAPSEPIARNFIAAKSSKGRPVLTMFGVQPISFEPEQMVEAQDLLDDREEETVDLTKASLAQNVSEETLKGRYSAITSFDVSKGVIEPISLKLGAFLPAVEQLMDCTKSLTERLTRASDGTYAKGTPSTPEGLEKWSKKIQAKYPFHLLRERQEATVDVRITVNKVGRASYCEVTKYSGPASFNDTACLLMLRHARFNPALDEEGNPVPSFYQTTISYRIRR